MSKELLTSHGGINTYLHYDAAEDKVHVQNTADISGLIEQNNQFKNDSSLTTFKDMRYVANIPLHVMYELQKYWKAQDIDPKKGLKQFLNDPDFSDFRTSYDKV